MNLIDWSKEIHENAVAHGWWEQKRPIEESLALIHSEWSEALEAYRDDEPMVHVRDGKPEGIAVELIDGCIRILDFAAHEGIQLTDNCIEDSDNADLPVLVNGLHYNISSISNHISKVGVWLHDDAGVYIEPWLSSSVNEVFSWIRNRGHDPIAIMRQKHEYNKTRPYKHGGKRC